MRVALLMKKMETRLKISNQKIQRNQITSQAAITVEADLLFQPTIWKKMKLVRKNNLI